MVRRVGLLVLSALLAAPAFAQPAIKPLTRGLADKLYVKLAGSDTVLGTVTFTNLTVTGTCTGCTSGAVPTTRLISTTSPLGGGGDLSADRTLTCTTCLVSGGALGTPASGVATNLTGTAAGLTVGFASASDHSIASCGANTWANGASTAWVLNCVQPAFSNISGSFTLAQFPTLATNTVLGNATSGSAVPTALAVGTCSGATNALIWATNTGFGCNGSITANTATTATTATNATNSAITNDTATNATMFPVWVTANAGNLPLKVTSTQFSFNPSTGNVGIGVAGGNEKLSVDATTASLAASFNSTNANGVYQVFRNSGTDLGYIGSSKALIGGGALADFAIVPASSNKFVLATNGIIRLTVDSSGNFSIPAGTFTLGATAQSLAAYTTAGAEFSILGRSITDTSSSGTVAVNAVHAVAAPTLLASSATTYTDSNELLLTGPPVASTNVTQTRAHTLAIVDSTSAASSITGAFSVCAALGTSATCVGIGGGNINAGGNGTFGGTLSVTGHDTLEGVTSTGATGTGKHVYDTSPTFTTSAISPLFRSTAAKVLVQGTGTGATQLSATQTTAPTCTTNCGTSPSVAGTDTAGIVTMGGTGSPASGWVVTFNGTWASAPACLVQSALSTMVVGKMPIAVVTTTTTITVTTNGTAPANSDKYQYICVGTQ